MDGAEECAWYRDVFDRSRALLPFLKDATIRAIPLVEALPAVYEMEEMLHALGPYAAGLNAARWDLKASIFEFVMADPNSVWPDRFGVDIKTTPFLSNIFRRLVAVCLKHGAVPIGGMATALPNPDPEVNRVAAESIKADKVWEAEQGFIRAWVAHIFHMKTAAEPFKRLHAGRDLEAQARDAEAGELPGAHRGARGPDHARRHAPQRPHGDRVRRGLAAGPRRQGHRQPRGQARRASGPDGRPGHRPHVGRPDRATHSPRGRRPIEAPPRPTTRGS